MEKELYSDFAKHLTSCHKISLLNQFKLLWMGTLSPGQKLDKPAVNSG